MRESCGGPGRATEGDPAKQSVTVTRMTKRERSSAIAITARAFWDDPLFNFFMPDLARQHRLGPTYFANNIDSCSRAGVVEIAHVDGTMAGVAAWLPPGAGTVMRPEYVVRLLRVLGRASNRRAAITLLREVERHEPAADQVFLSILACDPRLQGRGVASRLLASVLDRADQRAAPVFLRTQRESNLAFYTRFGFSVTDLIDLPESPLVWTMTRQPRTA